MAETEEKGGKACPFCRKKKRSPEEKAALSHRLNRIEGQIRGLSRMVEEDAYCPDILTQSAAAEAALRAFSRTLLEAHLRSCVKEDLAAGKEGAAEELIDLIRRMKGSL